MKKSMPNLGLSNITLGTMRFYDKNLSTKAVTHIIESCYEIGIDGLIIPDLPIDVYYQQYISIFETYSLINIFLITPQTSEKRIRFIDSISNVFIYMVSSASTTGEQKSFGEDQENYFKRIAEMKLKSPLIVGFGISNRET